MRTITDWITGAALCSSMFAAAIFPIAVFAAEDEPAEIFRQKLRDIKIEGESSTEPTSPAETESLTRLPIILSPTEEQELWRLQKESMHSFETGISFRNRDGDKGLDRLFETRAPVHFNFNTGGGRIDVDITSVYLSSGELTSSEFTNRYYGTFALLPPENRPIDDITADAVGTEIVLGYTVGGFAVEIGTTPLGFNITNTIGAISYDHNFDTGFSFGLGFYVEPVRDSVLSYAGIEDPVTGTEWGGVLKKGGDVAFGYDAGAFGAYIDLKLAVYEGQNIEDNDFQQISTGVYFYPYEGQRFKFSSGFNVTAFRFEENLRYFTFGHGGYFSPKTFVSTSIPFGITYTGQKLTVKLDLALGLQYFYEEGADFYPSDPVRQTLLETTETAQPTGFDDNTVRQFGSTGSIAVNYRLSRQLEAQAQLAFSNASDYEETTFLLGVQYLFGGD